MNRKLIYDLLMLALAEDVAQNANSSGEAISYCDFVNVASSDWELAFNVLSMHGVAAFAFDAVEKMPHEVRPPKEVLMKFISAKITGQKSYAKLQGLYDKIDIIIKENNLKCLLLKGLSLADYYPSPETRKFLDIDLYAPCAEAKVDQAFSAKGVYVDTEFYRHSHMTLGGILVENHHCLLDVRGRRKLAEMDADLKKMALKYLDGFVGPGLYYPDAHFSLIFNLHHAMSHFIYEGISFKFLVDWIYFLRKERKLLTTDKIAISLHKHGLMKFAAVMSEVSVRYLGLAPEVVPECIRTEMSLLKPYIVDRFIDDLFRPYEQVHRKNIFAERIGNVCRIVKSAWKPKVFLGQSAIGFVWDKFLPILMGKKYEAD